MKRRVYYLVPDIGATKSIIDELLGLGITKDSIHALTKPGINLGQLIGPDYANKNHRTMLLELFLWDSNLAVFFIAFICLIGMLIWWPTVWMIVPIVLMLMTFFAGAWYAIKIPFVNTNEFRDALSHGEILLVLEIDATDIYMLALAQRIHHHHPVAISGGTSWHSTLLHH